MKNNKLKKLNPELAVEYRDFLREILTKIQSARYEMLMSVGKQRRVVISCIVSKNRNEPSLCFFMA
ncbi:MAG: hypothetical protein LBN93_06095 [Candidatus Symbiothrix sp.]|jgi:hypothetical protein|nr:hypothetical protein [Candidatus Symbiothrix sp.]